MSGSAGLRGGAAAGLGALGTGGIQRHERAVGHALGVRQPVSGAPRQRCADDHPVADHERRQLAALDVSQRRTHPLLLVGQGLAPWERERGVAGEECGERVGCL